MKLSIFGATGRLGSAIVEKALDEGHFVTVLVRNPSKLKIRHEKLTIIHGDACDEAAVEKAVCNSEVVISAMATSASKKIAQRKPLTQGTKNIITAIKKHGVNRLIMTAGKVVFQPEDAPDIRFKLLKVIVKFLVPAAYNDTISSVTAVKSSDIEWTIVRVDRAAYASPTGVKVGHVNQEMGIGITRADAAAFILNELLDRKYLHQTPAICSRKLKK